MNRNREDSTKVNVQGFLRETSLLEVVSKIFSEERVVLASNLPPGVERVERVTVEAVRIKLSEKVDEDLLSSVSREEGYQVVKGEFSLRVLRRGAIIARVGSRSDPDGSFDLYVYPIPPKLDGLSIYRRILAEREGVVDPKTGKINLEKFYDFNMGIIRLVNKYLKRKLTK